MKKNSGLLLGCVIFLMGIGVVLLGSILKINHYTIGPITGNYLLIIGLVSQFIALIICVVSLLLNRKDKNAT